MQERFEQPLERVLARGTPITLELEERGAQQMLARLAEVGASYRVDVVSGAAEVTVELGGGLVVGATARCEGRYLEGHDAYELLRRADQGQMRVSPLRFPSLANILEPVAEVSTPWSARSTSAAGARSLRNLAAPASPTRSSSSEARSDSLASSGPEPSSSEAAADPITVPPPSFEVSATTSEAPSAAAHRGWTWMMGAAVVGMALGALAHWMSDGEGRELAPVAPGPTVAADRESRDAEDAASDNVLEDVDDALEDEPPASARHTRARALAREARVFLQRGRAQRALRRAQRAARLRWHLPYYQVLLGDALAANGQGVEAQRAWRRALRMRPGYQPAVRRLERQAAGQPADRDGPSA